MDPSKPELHFPVDWEFRIVIDSSSANMIKSELLETLKTHGQKPELTEGLSSSGGRYSTLKAYATLNSRVELETLATALGTVKGVKFVL